MRGLRYCATPPVADCMAASLWRRLATFGPGQNRPAGFRNAEMAHERTRPHSCPVPQAGVQPSEYKGGRMKYISAGLLVLALALGGCAGGEVQRSPAS